VRSTHPGKDLEIHGSSRSAGILALEVDGVDYRIDDRRSGPSRVILSGVTLRVERGSSIAVMGPSGAGKSTLLSICMGLIRPTAGSVIVAGRRLDGMSKARLAQTRSRHLGVVFQSGELLPELTPVDNVALPALLSKPDRALAYDRARRMLAVMGLEVEHTPTDRLSGGERQRVAVARALINEPDVILADEPTGSLDTAARDSVAEYLFGLPARLGCALLVVTHDAAIAARADATYDLVDGALRARG
jgi:lipoprotein-releasing system ATP-binding protein